ncbi:hypothetical protein GCM10028818_29510 [Spirosoma horti]
MKALLMFSCVAALVLSLNACNRNSVDPSTADASARSGGVASTSLTGPHSLTVVDVATLPAAITTYISTNYAGATIKEALKDDKGNYAVAITVSSTIKLLLFKADGTFVKVADGKPGRAPRDSANHAPGDSAHHPRHTPGDSVNHPKPPRPDSANHPRPGKGPDVTTVATSSLPAAITSYINTNYAGAKIDKAVQEKMSGDYLVAITTTDKKRVALLFGSDGTFKKAVTGR